MELDIHDRSGAVLIVSGSCDLFAVNFISHSCSEAADLKLAEQVKIILIDAINPI